MRFTADLKQLFLTPSNAPIDPQLVSSAEIIELESHRRIWVHLDHTGKKYVGWEDTRLGDEMNLWIKRYS